MKRSSRDPRYLAVLALAAGGILVLGNWLRPDTGADEGSSQMLAGDTLLQLPRLTQRRSIEDRVEFVTQLVTSLNPYIYRLETADRSAVLWNAATLVSVRTTGRMPTQDEAFGDGRGLEVSVNTAGPHLPLVLMEANLERPPSPIVRASSSEFSQGSWVLALWRGSDDAPAWAEGQYLRSGMETCGDLTPAQTMTSTIPLSPQMAGAGIFGLDGTLIGIVGSCDNGLTIFGMQAVEALFGRAGELTDRLLYRYGLRVGELSEAEKTNLRATQGLVVRETWIGYRGYASGLRPGEVIVSIDGNATTKVDELQLLVLPIAQEIFELQTISQGRRRSISLRARPETEPVFLAGGVALSAGESGIRIAQVAPGGPFAAARVRAGDRLLSLDGRVYEDSAAVSRYLEQASKPVWATFQRGDRLWGALLFDE